MILEVCAFNIQSCRIAEQAGASRIEFCSDPLQGGVTPSMGAIQFALQHINIPVFPMIRPRGGNFMYDADELDIMKRDILLCKEMGCPGIATGIQNTDKRIATEQLKRLVEWAYPMQVTCHKVFDGAPDAAEALEAVIAAGCTRILTSGLAKTAIEGAEVLRQLIAQANGRIIIMPGGSVRSTNISELISQTGAQEYHSSCIASRTSGQIADLDEAMSIVHITRTIGR